MKIVIIKNITLGLVLLSGVITTDSQADRIEQGQGFVMNSILEIEHIDDYLKNFSPEAKEVLSQEIFSSEFAGVISADLVSKLAGMKEGNPGSIQDLMLKLLPVASQYSLPPVSNFRVGAISQGESGALYLGANLEIAQAALGFTVHAEQSAVNNALLHGEPGIKRIAVTAAPCGHCRQFLNELNTASSLEIIIVGRKSVLLSELLPGSFGPADLGVTDALLSKANSPLQCKSKVGDEMACSGWEVAQHSYAPYSGSPSSVILKVKNKFFGGVYVENAAFNPSLPPLLSALDRLRFQETNFSNIQEVVLFELAGARISQASYTKAIIGEVAPTAEFRIVKIGKAEDK